MSSHFRVLNEILIWNQKATLMLTFPLPGHVTLDKVFILSGCGCPQGDNIYVLPGLLEGFNKLMYVNFNGIWLVVTT